MDLHKAGKILSKTLAYSLRLLDEERDIMKIADRTEEKIKELGGYPAFPCNICIDHIAAHYTPSSRCREILDGAVVKIDVGAHINGWIADAAYSFCLNRESEKISRAAFEALDAAINKIKPGIRTGEIGREIEKKIKAYGLKPIKNLGGHEIKRFSLHGGIFIPNIGRGKDIIEEGMIIAIEPFATNGSGIVREGKNTYIYSVGSFRARTKGARELLNLLYGKYNKLPFARRWIERDFNKHTLYLNELIKTGCLIEHPVLIEEKTALVGQWENTVYVEKDSAIPIVELPELF